MKFVLFNKSTRLHSFTNQQLLNFTFDVFGGCLFVCLLVWFGFVYFIIMWVFLRLLLLFFDGLLVVVCLFLFFFVCMFACLV